jgi:hypothetical protein
VSHTFRMAQERLHCGRSLSPVDRQQLYPVVVPLTRSLHRRVLCMSHASGCV